MVAPELAAPTEEQSSGDIKVAKLPRRSFYVVATMAPKCAYDMREIKAPRVTGAGLKLLRRLAEGPRTAKLAYHLVAAPQNNFQQFPRLALNEEPKPSGVPEGPLLPEKGAAPVADASSPGARVAAALESLGWTHAAAGGAAPLQADPGARPGILDYHRAFASGAASPVSVAEAIISFLESEPGAQNWLCDWDPDHLRAQAAASAARYAAGRPLSVLDGVPYAVKDHVEAFATRCSWGTTFLGDRRGPVPSVEQEAPCVAALRSLGAVCVGKTQMQEFGLLPTGIAPKLGVARNPHSLRHAAGGSSGGSGCVVGAGLVAFAIGTDGGGSVRIPAAVCGVVGLKPTQGRMASHPEESSLSSIGPLACSVGDAMIVYAAMACPGACSHSPLGPISPADANQAVSGARTAEGAQAEVDAAARAVAAAAAAPPPAALVGEDAAARPPLGLPRRLLPEAADTEAAPDARSALFASRPLAGMRVGVFEPWFADCEPGVAAAARSGLSLLARLGAQVVAIVLPELEQLRVAHTVAFMREGLRTRLCSGVWADPEQRGLLHDDTRMMLATASHLTDAHYETALRVRRRQSEHFARAFEECDVIVTPTVATPGIEIVKGAESDGMLHLTQTCRLTRFTIQASLLGLPALAVPVGAVRCGGTGAPLPASLQIVGRPWHDATVLRAGAALEAALAAAGGGAPLPTAARMPNPLARA